ncbi:MAG TPA: ABC transporter permease [Pseudonocardiaceae bacterium]|nr:ABC transporter permease [Pseudonocardiaceae bacterium]
MADQESTGQESKGAESQGIWAEWWDAVEIRTVLLIVGVLLLQLGFILSYVGAFHAPRPQHIPLAVVAPAPAATQIVGRLNGINGSPVNAAAVADETTARRQLADGNTSGVLIVRPSQAPGTTDTLLVASGGGSAVSTAVQSIVTQAEAAQRRNLSVQDVVPEQAGDARGLSGFYLVVGWIVGGYLVAALLGVARGSRPTTVRRAGFRLVAIVPYAIVSGLGGAVIVGPVLGAITGHLLALWWVGALLVLAAATVTMAFQVLFGVIGIGITVLVFVILGNPSAGGAYQPSLLPPFWRAISGALPNGAGTDTVRRIVYFGGNGIAAHLIVLAIYVVAGAALALVAAAAFQRRADLT